MRDCHSWEGTGTGIPAHPWRGCAFDNVHETKQCIKVGQIVDIILHSVPLSSTIRTSQSSISFLVISILQNISLLWLASSLLPSPPPLGDIPPPAFGPCHPMHLGCQRNYFFIYEALTANLK